MNLEIAPISCPLFMCSCLFLSPLKLVLCCPRTFRLQIVHSNSLFREQKCLATKALLLLKTRINGDLESKCVDLSLERQLSFTPSSPQSYSCERSILCFLCQFRLLGLKYQRNFPHFAGKTSLSTRTGQTDRHSHERYSL